MKPIALIIAFFLLATSTSLANEPRTVGTYKRHMQSEDHRSNNFDHTLHHLLYLSGINDGYTVINKRRAIRKEPLLYCPPELKPLDGAELLKIFENKLSDPESPVSDELTVAEALLLALQDKFPCQ